jgi:uncharacterized membrane protein YdfJ with MMPL/SSD domain
VVAWVAAAVAVPHFLPSLASVTQGNNADFLPASAPSEHAAKLAAPSGTTNVVPVLVLAARPSAQLTSSDQAWLAQLQKDLHGVRTVQLVRDLGPSPDGHTEQLEVLSNVSQGNSPAVTDLVDGLRSAISRASPPSGLFVHLAGAIPIAVDQQKQTGDTGTQIQGLSVVFIIILLALGEDYNILVMSRIREEARSLPLGEAVTRALNATGTTVTSAGLVLAGTFGVFALVGARTSGGSQFVNLAVGLALGILMDTFLVRTLLVPSTVLLLGRWNWWPSKMSRRPAAVPPAGADQAIPHRRPPARTARRSWTPPAISQR